MYISLPVALMLGASSLLGASTDIKKAHQVVEKSLENYTSDDFQSLYYKNDESKFYHSSYPFQTYNAKHWGEVIINHEALYVLDTFKGATSPLSKSVMYGINKFGLIDAKGNYADTVYTEDHEDYFFKSFIYTPFYALSYFTKMQERQFIDMRDQGDEYVIRYNHESYHHLISIYINKKTKLVTKIEDLTERNPWGDHLKTYQYSNYSSSGKFHYAQQIKLIELDSVMNDVQFSYNKVSDKASIEIKQAIMVDEPIEEYEVVYSKYNDIIHFVDFVTYKDRAILVEFDSFVFVINAPLYASNGIEIKQQVREHIKKPIKYLSFGHHHPDYIGGIRAFADTNTSIICHRSVYNYIDFVITNPRTINPYFYGLDPKKSGYNLMAYDSSYTINDGSYEMQMLFLGNGSNHTMDYTVFYFPQYNLLIEDDLIFIVGNDKMKPTNQGPREKGLFDFIVSKGLTVDTIIQNYPAHSDSYKTIFSMDELKQRDEE